MQLAGAVAVVTGAGHGIGRATAQALAQQGATVVAAGLSEGELASLVQEIGGSYLPVDVRDPAHAGDVIKHAVERHGRLDVVVANAGIGHAGAVAGMTAERICDLVDINVRAPLLITRAALPGMLERGRGSIVLVSSIAGRVPVTGEAVYSATKAAIEAFAEPLREELRGTGVTVSTVAPGVVASHFFDERGAPYQRRYPRPVPPERIADAIVQAVQNGTPQTVVPRWLALPARVRGLAPGVFRLLARRFG
ncbi:MAG TPA: SDR family oxidoreductase [Mycobacteriales bacterium]|nr:SDR family oxidoreductase [Mycobacteriales bacterium]